MIFSPEERYLAHLCRLSPPLDGETVPPAPLNWDEDAFLKLTFDNTLGPLLLWKFDHPGEWQEQEVREFEDRLSSSGRQRLRASFQRSWVSSIMRERLLASVATLFRTVGVRFALYKGIATCRELYAEKALRPMADIDLIITPDDLPSAVEILESEGYRSWSDTHGYERGFKAPSTEINLDLHFHVNWPYQSNIDPCKLLSHAEFGDGGYASFPLPEQVLLHVLHQCKHGFIFPYVRLSSFVELREMLLLLSHDWGKVERLAEKWQLKNVLSYGLWFLDILYPGFLSEKLRPTTPVLTPILQVLRQPISKTHPELQHFVQWQLRRLFATTMIDQVPKRLAYLYKRGTHWIEQKFNQDKK